MLSTRGITSLCELCRRWSSGRLCGACEARHTGMVPRCPRCALRLPITGAACPDCLRDAPLHRSACCVADYAYPWDRLIGQLKFDGEVELAKPLAALLVRALERGAHPLPDLVVPVPLTTRRLAGRGYNQAWELARRAAKAVGRPAHAEVLQRWIDTPAQAALDRQARLANLRAAFGVDASAREKVRGRSVALVDDVMTTGATARQCSAALLAAGAAAVDVWVVARTPAP